MSYGSVKNQYPFSIFHTLRDNIRFGLVYNYRRNPSLTDTPRHSPDARTAVRRKMCQRSSPRSPKTFSPQHIQLNVLHNPPPQPPPNPISLLPFSLPPTNMPSLLRPPNFNHTLPTTTLTTLFNQSPTLPTPLPPLRDNTLRNAILRPMSRRRRLDQSARLFLVAVAWEPVVDRLDGVWVDGDDAAAASGRRRGC